MVVGNPRHSAAILADDAVDGFFHFQVRHHFARDLAESRQPVRDAEETFIVQRADIARHVPPVVHRFRRSLRLIQIADHPVGTFYQHQSFHLRRQWLHGGRIHNLHRNAWKRMAHRARLVAQLRIPARFEIRTVHRDHWRHLRTSISFQ